VLRTEIEHVRGKKQSRGNRRTRAKSSRSSRSSRPPGTSGPSRSSAGSAQTTSPTGSPETTETSARRIAPSPWWQRYPHWLDEELAELERLGIEYQRDETAFANGVAQLLVYPEIDGHRQQFIVAYPDLYPDVRPEVFAPHLSLDHHQHPFTKNLCLIGRNSGYWRPTDTLATLLRDQLPDLLRSGQSSDKSEVATVEEHQAEPFSDYYVYQRSAMILVDSGWSLDSSVAGGTVQIAFEGQVPSIRGVVLEVSDDSGNVLAQADAALAKRFAGGQKITGRWIRSGTEIRGKNGAEFTAALIRQSPEGANATFRPVNHRLLNLIGVVFPEETDWRRNSDGWIFLERVKQVRTGPVEPHLIRAGYAGRNDLTARIPELATLNARRIAVFGLGSLGMPSAIAFARAGIGELRVLDSDFVEPGTTSRWPLGLSIVGLPKAQVLCDFLSREYPYTVVEKHVHRLGGIRNSLEDASCLEVLDEMLNGADLAYDALAEEGLTPLLDRMCRERGIPFVSVSGTNGAWGGTIVRTRHGTGCWHCFLAAQLDGSLPFPLEAPSDRWVQPVGCASPTFTGAGFDLERIVQEGVRLAIGTLTGEAGDGYPDCEWDVAIGDFRDNQTRAISPQWRVYPLTQRPECLACGGQ
jgi:tRNA A37 threonylcarbamoyladenosine dehydratase